jgi:glycosyltransferase involved in cell wall biosynthesis
MSIYSETPLVSVVMPAYNVEDYIEEAVNSILGQSYSNFEFIIIDDGSTDRTPEILKSFTDPRIKLIFSEKNEGNYPARNKGCQLAKGRYIAVMDADDIAMPERFAVQVKYLEENADVLLCGSAFKLLGKDLTIVEPISYEEIKYVLVKTFCMSHPTIMFRQKVMEEVGCYRTDSLYAEDYDLVLRLALKGKVTNVPDVLLIRRQHKQQISTAYNREQNEFSRKIQLRYQHEIGIYYPPSDKLFFLSQLAFYLRSTVSYLQSGGLYHGRLGLILFFYQYGAYSKDIQYKDLADKMLSNLLTNLKKNIPIDISNGLCGIGLAIGYLLHCGFVEGEPDEVLSEIDKMIIEKTDFDMEDWSFETGIMGIIYYVSYRLSIKKRQGGELFNFEYVRNLLQVIDKLQKHKDWICPIPEILSSCKICLEGEIIIINWKDFMKKIINTLPISQSLGSWPLGINNGASGYGLNILLNLDI